MRGNPIVARSYQWDYVPSSIDTKLGPTKSNRSLLPYDYHRHSQVYYYIARGTFEASKGANTES